MVTAFPVAVKLMSWPSKAPTVVLCRGLVASDYIAILVLIPLMSFGFIPLSIVFDLNVATHALILSGALIFFIDWRRTWGMTCRPKLD